jgi:thiol-disulfide isomerase/thioredoxin
MKKLIVIPLALVLALLLLIGALAGCGGDAELPEPGTMVAFETTDLDGNPVTAQELFSAHAVTMVNVWASWCPPCVRALPDLQRLSGEFAEKDCALVGFLIDGDEAQGLADAKARLQEAGVTYPILLPCKELNEIFSVQAVPTSFFVDSGGRLIGEPIVGAYVEGYTAALDAAIAQAGK